jgi:hypothetical protein
MRGANGQVSEGNLAQSGIEVESIGAGQRDREGLALVGGLCGSGWIGQGRLGTDGFAIASPEAPEAREGQSASG